MIRVVLFVAIALTAVPIAVHAQPIDDLLNDRRIFETAIETERPAFDTPAGVTGITVPHHLVAADLIARGFWAASSGSYDRILLLAPDHYRAVDRAFATADASTETVFGSVPGEAGTIDQLLQTDLFTLHDRLAGEHAVSALLPFAAYFFPGVPVIPVVASADATPADWQTASELLAPLVTKRTLVIQSTDYAHYLSQAESALHDQESLNMISAGRADLIEWMSQPDHLDAKAAQFIQMHLQAAQQAQPTVIANRNSADYGGDAGSTTSYIVTVYHAKAEATSALDYSDQQRILFAGDLLLGRHIMPLLQSPEALAAILNRVTRAGGGAPIVVNLEGVITEDPVANARPGAHWMHAPPALPVMRYLNITAAGLANNHALDFGVEAADDMAFILNAAGHTPIRNRTIVDLGAVRVLGLDDVDRGEDSLGALCAHDSVPPLVAFVHWGNEYDNTPTERTRALQQELVACGISAIIGAHSHVASTGIDLAGGTVPMIHSLGNFLFDQSEAMPVSGALAEIRVFRQGTFALRLIPLPNLFELGHAARTKSR